MVMFNFLAFVLLTLYNLKQSPTVILWYLSEFPTSMPFISVGYYFIYYELRNVAVTCYHFSHCYFHQIKRARFETFTDI